MQASRFWEKGSSSEEEATDDDTASDTESENSSSSSDSDNGKRGASKCDPNRWTNALAESEPPEALRMELDKSQ